MMVPLVSQYAWAGYWRGFADAEYMDELPKVPMLVTREYKGEYVAFEMAGDSMEDGTPDSYKAGDILYGRKIQQQHWHSKLHIKKYDFILVHKTDGILVKRITKHDLATGMLTLHSLNTLYDDIEVNISEMKEIRNVVQSYRNRARS